MTPWAVFMLGYTCGAVAMVIAYMLGKVMDGPGGQG